MLFDIHVHMGQFFDDYYTPPRVLRTLKCAGITHFAYSSTSNVVTGDPAFMREEREAMRELSAGRAVALLWVTHSMLRKSRDLALYLDDGIRGLKVHGGSELTILFFARCENTSISICSIVTQIILPLLVSCAANILTSKQEEKDEKERVKNLKKSYDASDVHRISICSEIKGAVKVLAKKSSEEVKSDYKSLLTKIKNLQEMLQTTEET